MHKMKIYKWKRLTALLMTLCMLLTLFPLPGGRAEAAVGDITFSKAGQVVTEFANTDTVTLAIELPAGYKVTSVKAGEDYYLYLGGQTYESAAGGTLEITFEGLYMADYAAGTAATKGDLLPATGFDYDFTVYDDQVNPADEYKSAVIYKVTAGSGGGSGEVAKPTIKTGSQELTAGEEGKAYSYTLEAIAANGKAITWKWVSGNLPGGLTLSSTGVLSGVPGAAGDFNFTVEAAEAEGGKVTKEFTLSIREQVQTENSLTVTLPAELRGCRAQLHLTGVQENGGAKRTLHSRYHNSAPPNLTIPATVRGREGFSELTLQANVDGVMEDIAAYVGSISPDATDVSLVKTGDWEHVKTVSVPGLTSSDYSYALSYHDGSGSKAVSLPALLNSNSSYKVKLYGKGASPLYYEYKWSEYNEQEVKLKGDGILRASVPEKYVPDATLSGQVSGGNGEALPNATVTATQYVGAQARSVSDLTDDDGNYTMKIYPDDTARLSVVYLGMNMTITAGATTLSPPFGDSHNNLTVESNRVRVSGEVKPADGAGQELLLRRYLDALDCTLSYSLKQNDTNIGGDVAYYGDLSASTWLYVNSSYSGSRDVTLSWSGDAFSPGQTNVTMESGGLGVATITPALKGGVVGKFQVAADVSSGQWHLCWYNGNGEFVGARSFYIAPFAVARDFAAYCPGNAGTYTVALVPSTNYSTAKNSSPNDLSDYWRKNVTIEAGAIADLGIVAISAAESESALYVTQPNSSLAAGVQSFSSETDLIAFAGHIGLDSELRGGKLRTLVINSLGDNTNYQSTADVQELVINGQKYKAPVNSRGQYESSDLDISLPCDFTLYCRPGQTKWDMDVSVTANVDYNDGNAYRQLIGNVQVARPGASISALARWVSEGMITLTGTTVKDEEVTIYDNGVQVGTAKADQYGRWSARIPLYRVARGESKYLTLHELRAQTAAGEWSEPLQVRHLPNGPELTDFTMSYNDGVTIPIGGKYLFTGVMNDTCFTAKFKNPGKLKTMTDSFDCQVVFKVWTSDSQVRFLKAKATGSGGSFTATIPGALTASVTRAEVLYEPDTTGSVAKNGGGDYLQTDIDAVYKPDVIKDSIERIASGPFTPINVNGWNEYKTLIDDPDSSVKAAVDDLQGAGIELEKLTVNKGAAPHLAGWLQSFVAPPDDTGKVYSRGQILEDATALREAMASLGGETKFAKLEVAGKTFYSLTLTDEAYDKASGKIINPGTYLASFIFMADPVNDIYAEESSVVIFSGYKGSLAEELAALPTAWPGPNLVAARTLLADNNGGEGSGQDGGQGVNWEIVESVCNYAAIGVVGAFDFSVLLFQELVEKAAPIDDSLGKLVSKYGSPGGMFGSVLGGLNIATGATDTIDDLYSQSKGVTDFLERQMSDCFKKLTDQQKRHIMEQNEVVIDRMMETRKVKSNWLGTSSSITATGMILGATGAGALPGLAVFGVGLVTSLAGQSFCDSADAELDEALRFANSALTHFMRATGDPDCGGENKQDGDGANNEVGNDPSGIVYEAVIENPVAGAAVTLYYGADASGNITTAEGSVTQRKKAENMRQLIPENPVQTTGEDGRFGWGVPEGLWYVTADKGGYESGSSAADTEARTAADGTNYLPVLPVQLDVNIPLIDKTAPTVNAEVYSAVYAAASPGLIFNTEGVYVAFSKYMDEDTLISGNFTLKVDGRDRNFTIEKVERGSTPSNRGAVKNYTRTVLLKTNPGLEVGAEVELTVKSGVKSYAGIPLGSDFNATSRVTAKEAVNPPVFASAGGEVDYGSTVSIAIPAGAVVYYTTDGSDPGSSATRIKYTVPIAVTQNMTIKAVAEKIGCNNSAVAEVSFTVRNRIKPIPLTPVTPITPITPVKPAPGSATSTIGGGSARPSLTTSFSSDGSISLSELEQLAKAERSLTVRGKDGAKIVFDALALEGIIAQVKDGGSDTATNSTSGSIVMEVKDVSAAYQQDYPGRVVFSLTVTAAGKNIAGFDGKITISLPYELQKGENPQNVTIWHVAEDGALTEIPCTYDPATKLATFTVDHFSLYMVGTVPGKALATGPAVQNPFNDVKSGDWFYDAVMYVYEQGLMKGTDTNTFSPYLTTTRGMIVTILWLLENEPGTDLPPSFNDVTADKYYYKAVAWASGQGIVNGYSARAFGPEDNITREQLATILYNYAAWKGMEPQSSGDLTRFSDANQISAWAKTPLSWANGAGLINGIGDNRLDPVGQAQRCQAASILRGFMEK